MLWAFGQASGKANAEAFTEGPFCGGTQTLRLLEFEETEVVKSVEDRDADMGLWILVTFDVLC